MKQSGISGLEYDTKKKKTRKEQFQAEVDTILRWKVLLSESRRHYPKGRTIGRQSDWKPFVRVDNTLSHWLDRGMKSDLAIDSHVVVAFFCKLVNNKR